MTLTALTSAVVSTLLLTSAPTGQVDEPAVVDDRQSTSVETVVDADRLEVTALETTTAERLSTRQIDQYLTTSNLPENCWVEYLGGTLICAGVICDINGVWVPFECEEFGL